MNGNALQQAQLAFQRLKQQAGNFAGQVGQGFQQAGQQVQQAVQPVFSQANQYIQSVVNQPPTPQFNGFQKFTQDIPQIMQPLMKMGQSFGQNVFNATPPGQFMNAIQQAPKALNTIGNIQLDPRGAFAGTNYKEMYTNPAQMNAPSNIAPTPTFPARELLNPKSLMGGPAGQFVSNTLGQAMPGFTPDMQLLKPGSFNPMPIANKFNLARGLGGAGVGVGIQGASNVLSGQPITQGLPQAGVAGFAGGEAFGENLTKPISEQFTNKPKGIEPSVVQIVNKQTGDMVYKVIPSGQLKQFDNLIDNTKTGIGHNNGAIDGNIYALSAKTPTQMEEKGFKFGGVAKVEDIPKKPNIANQPIGEINNINQINPQNVGQMKGNEGLQQTIQPAIEGNKTIRATPPKDSSLGGIVPQDLAPSQVEQLKNVPVVKNGSGGNGDGGLIKQLMPNNQVGDRDIQNLLREKRGNFDLQRDIAFKNSEPMQNFWNGQKKEERLGFMQRVQSGMQQPTPELQQLAQEYRTKFDSTYEIAKQVKPDLPYKSDYFTKSGIWADSTQAEAFYNKFMNDKLANTPGSFKQTVFPTILDGVQAGLKLRETNPEALYLNNYVQVQKAKMASDFMSEAQNNGWDMGKVQKVIDTYMQPGFGGQTWFRNIKQVNNVLNSIDLSLSGFHVMGTGINASISKASMGLNQLLTGHPLQAVSSFVQVPTASLEYVFRGNKIMDAAKKGKITPDIQNIIDAGGRVQPQVRYQGSGLQKALANTIDDINSGKTVSAVLKAPFRAVGGIINEAAKPIMEYWVPRIKNGALADLIENNIKNAPKGSTPEELRAIKATASDSIDNRFGQLVQDNLFWNKGLKDLLGIGFRSPGWNIGTVRELGLGARDLLDVKRLLSGQGVSDRAAYTVALPIMTGLLGAAYQYLHTGKGPQQTLDYFWPKTGQVDPKTGKEERVGFPTYMKDVFAFFKDPAQTVLNKASPLLSDIQKQIKGVDYFGKPISDPNANLGTQLRQRLAQEVVSHVPFSISSGVKRLNPNTETTAESLMGINKAPASIMGGYYDTKAQQDKTLSPDQKKIADYMTTSVSNGGPSAADKAKIFFTKGNEWVLNYMKNNTLAANPQDPLWSRPEKEITAYLAYQATSDIKQKAALRVQFPFIYDIQKQIGDNIQANVAANQQTQTDKSNSLMGKVSSALGVYNPQPNNPTTVTPRQPTPKDALSADQKKVVDAYTALPQGSIQRRQLLNQNPWLKGYWDQNSKYYQQNPIQNNNPLSQYLQSVGINPNTQTTSGGAGGGGGTSAAFAKYFFKKNMKQIAKNVPGAKVKIGRVSKRGFKVAKSKSVSFKVPKFKARGVKLAKSKF